MPHLRMKCLGVCVLAILTTAFTWVLGTRSEPARLIVRGFKVQKWSVATAKSFDQHECIFAHIELTNTSTRPILYPASRRPDAVEYTILYHTSLGWEDPFTGVSLRRRPVDWVLAPGQAVKFDAAVEKDKPCKVALPYNCKSPVWSRLPQPFSRWLPIHRTGRTVTSDVIDLRQVATIAD